MAFVCRPVRALIATAAVLLAAAAPAQADMCDLSTAGYGCGAGTNQQSFSASGAIFQEISRQLTTNNGTQITGFQPTGTGYVDSFLRIQNNGTEQGYNTDSRPYQFDQKDPINYTHAISINEVPKVQISGTWYREFFLDINEPTATPLISLDELQIFLSPNPTLNNYSAGKLNGITPIFDLDSTKNNWIKLNYALNGGGSGKGDMVAFIPDALFTNTASNPYVYLYSQFGGQNSANTCYCSAGDGFEEWWTKSMIMPPPQSAVPEPASLLLLGSGVLAAARRFRKS